MDGNQKTPENTLQEVRIFGQLALHVRNMRTSNSVFDVGMLMQGGYGAVLNQHSWVWDNVAQQFIVEEAGGVYTDFWGKPFVYTDPLDIKQNYTFCIATKEIHKEVQAVLKKLR